jgi:hypothetical protein
VPNGQDFDKAAPLLDPVEDSISLATDLTRAARAVSLIHRSYGGESRENIDRIEQFAEEGFRRRRTRLAYMPHGGFQVGGGGLGPNYREIRAADLRLTSSCEATRPSSASASPRRMAASMANSWLISSRVDDSGILSRASNAICFSVGGDVSVAIGIASCD